MIIKYSNLPIIDGHHGVSWIKDNAILLHEVHAQYSSILIWTDINVTGKGGTFNS